MATQLSRTARAQRQSVDFGVSLDRNVLEGIDKMRGDTSRSLWLKRLAVKELERLGQLEKPQQQKKRIAVCGGDGFTLMMIQSLGGGARTEQPSRATDTGTLHDDTGTATQPLARAGGEVVP